MRSEHISQEIVRSGQIILSGLPFAEGQAVEVAVAELPQKPQRGIADVRGALRGHVDQYQNPFEPILSVEDWEMRR